MTKKKKIRLLSRLKCMCLTTKWNNKKKEVKQRPGNKKKENYIFFYINL